MSVPCLGEMSSTGWEFRMSRFRHDDDATRWYGVHLNEVCELILPDPRHDGAVSEAGCLLHMALCLTCIQGSVRVGAAVEVVRVRLCLDWLLSLIAMLILFCISYPLTCVASA